MNMQDALKKVEILEKELAELKVIINKPIDIKDRIKTFEDACKYRGIDPIKFIKDRNSIGLSPSEIAYSRLTVIISALNEDWIPDWNNSFEYKYYCYWNMDSSSLSFSYTGYDIRGTRSAVSESLCLRNDDLAKYVGTQFLEEYRPYMLSNTK